MVRRRSTVRFRNGTPSSTAGFEHRTGRLRSWCITVTVRFYSARWPGDGQPVAAIRQRTRSDHDYPDIGYFPDCGQAMTWQLWWQHTPMLLDDQRGTCVEDIAEISREEAEQIAAELAARSWPPDAARLPWVVSAYPEDIR